VSLFEEVAMKRLLIGTLLALSALMAWALPTVKEVEAQVQQGHYAEAERLMGEVVQAKPGSAKAHYLYAQLLAHNGKLPDALTQTQLARQSDPAIGFTQPDKFRSFEQALKEATAPAATRSAPRLDRSADRVAGGAGGGAGGAAPTTAPPRAEASAGLPSWVWIAGLAALAVFAWKLMARRSAGRPGFGNDNPSSDGPGAPPPSYGPAGQPGYGQAGYGAAPGPGQPAARSGLLGAGLGAAGGFAAGMLADRLLNQPAHAAESSASHAADAPGHLQPGMFDDYNALQERSIDFGSGNDWDAASSDGGGSDGGGSDDW
jgi:hypothetical protein